MIEFQIGDVVSWESNGLKKKGQIVSSVPEGTQSVTAIPPGLNASLELNRDGVRREDSFLVLVDRGDGKKPGLYWPLTGLLKKKPSKPAEKDLPGMPDPGPTHNAAEDFVQQRCVIEEEKGKLDAIGQRILGAMKKEGRAVMVISTHGERYKFSIKESNTKLVCTKAKEKKV